MSIFLEKICTLNASDDNSKDSIGLPVLEIEENFDSCLAFTWLWNNWTLCYYIIAAYLLVIFSAKEYMRYRPPFHLKRALFVWNVSLAAYSAISAWRMLPTTIYSISTYGFWEQTCDIVNVKPMKVAGVWMFMFAMSKVVELGDTAFIVLRKTPLIMLHWYHHATVLFFTWSSSAYPSPMQVVFCTTNVCVHSVMYSYYALRVLKVRIPKFISMAVTALQLIQMAIGMFVTWATYDVKTRQQHCLVPDQAVIIASSIYFSYFMLFSQFFVDTYVRPKSELAKKMA